MVVFFDFLNRGTLQQTKVVRTPKISFEGLAIARKIVMAKENQKKHFNKNMSREDKLVSVFSFSDVIEVTP